MKSRKLIVILQVILVSVAFSQTYIPPGDVSGIWTLSSSPYYIQGEITIPNDSTLIIEPGVLVEFQGHYALNVQGRLLAIGSETQNITFTINDTTGFYNSDTTLGGWYGIRFIDTPVQNDTSKIIYCKLQYGKAVGSSPPDNSGGAIFISNFSKVLISHCSIVNNSAGGLNSPTGGGIGLQFANIKLEDNLISNNKAWDGGGIQIWESYVVFNDNIIKQNNAIEGGGGIWVGGNSSIEFNNDNIIENFAGNNGGGIVCWQTTNTNLDSVILKNNLANFGGGIAVFDCNLQLEYCNLSDNASSINGGGLNGESSTIVINNTDFNKDTATLSGGALAINNSELFLTGCNLIDNGAGIRGGGILSNSSIINIANTSFERDTVGIFGGAIQVNYSELFINNCNLVDNIARVAGGAIHSDFSTINISNTTFERDTSGNAGGGIFTWQCSLNVEGCEFLNNSATNNGGAISSSNCNLLVDSCMFFQNLVGNEAGAIECFIDTTYFTAKLSIQINNSEFLNNSSGNLFAGVKIRQDNSDTALCSVRMDNNLFKDNTAYSYSAIRFIGNIDNIIVSNSIFDNNYNYSPIYHSIFSANGGAKVEVNNSVFANNYPRAASLNLNARIDFMNCTFTNNYGTNSAALSLRNNAEATITNSILWNNGNNPILLVNVGTNGSFLTANYSDIQYGPDSLIVPDSLSVLNWGVGNIDAVPLFVDTLNNDFHLQDLSPCIASGIDSIEIAGFWYYCPLKDIEGNPRPNPSGTLPDMGAYESEFPVRVGDQYLDLPTEYALYQNYPNPFNPSTTIKWEMRKSGLVTLIIYDVLGREVITLVNEELSAGKHEVVFDASRFSSGIYFYQLKADKFLQTKKIILIK
jgi:predicted outer membrane repeat protein